MGAQDFFVALALAYGSLAVLLVLADRPRLTDPMGMLAGAYGSIAVGVMLQGLAGPLPYWVHALVGNLLAWIGLLYQGWAILGLSGRQAAARVRLTVLGCLLVVALLMVAAPPVARFASANVLYATLLAFSAWGLIRWVEAPRLLRWVTAGLLGVTAALYAIRAVAFVVGSIPPVFDRTPGQPWTTLLMYPLIYATLLSGAFSLLLLTRLSAERQLREVSGQLAHLAAYDDLTGLPNRRSLLERGRAEVSRAVRTGRPLSVAVVDLDRLKLMNDSHGHAAGDEALRRVARACHASFREVDLAARVGGDEFAVLLPDSTLAQAKAALERLLDALRIEELSIDGDLIPLTASIGVAALEPGETIDEVYTRADRAMYVAKRAGGGAVVIGSAMPVVPIDPLATDTNPPPP